MAIKSKAELLAVIQERFGGDTTDEVLAFIEDVNDTFTDLETKANGESNWETKYKENDAAWRKRYRDRFFDGGDNPAPQPKDPFEEPETSKTKTFEELFKED